ncbi:response regulator receiver modulated CheB methylesterase [Rhodopirellula maiorica SM1]|uniref:Protein-glutamate methylesterase/protein-glutamine glutaminase n=1 Tax=Rhodopirellula maiorica SM1 TaxID=1265738 RepID=M5RPR7_9BACT|nr:chemotaxis-specific protein-glutamate methyltransferase CheB [Rhodopirellula maiorica]EMI15964.1 response regulator receiver modulated CheB methylesterase [Rhodopirellula maiorica SM1]
MHTVLIVDDSATAREVLRAILCEEAGFRVIGFAKDGHEAVEKAKELHPDVITMDINMPGMNGLDATREIMIEAPTPIVIVSASTRVREIEASMEALGAGALAILLKPPGPHSPKYAALAKEIVKTVKAMAGVLVIRRRRRLKTNGETNVVRELPDPPKRGKIQLVSILSSTGGPPALAKVLGELPANFPAPILLVQHMVPSFVAGFASWLDSVIPLPVRLACDHERIEQSCVYVAAAGSHLGVTRGSRICLSDDPPIDGFQPAGTHLFASVAEQFGNASAGVIMTGMGRDGVDGLQRIYDAGGTTIAQDEATSVVFGMAKVAIEQKIIGSVLPLDQIGKQLQRLVH